MKLKKLLLTILVIATSIILGIGQNASYAADTLYVGLKIPNVREKTGFAIGDPYNGGTNPGKRIWDFNTYTDSNGTSKTSENHVLYCAKGGVGFELEPNKTLKETIKPYNKAIDLKTSKNTVSSFTNYSDITGANYDKIMWILNNMYVPAPANASAEEKAAAEADKATLLKAAGIDTTDDFYKDYPLTFDEISAVQQMAIWYYTNSDAYHVSPSNFTTSVFITTDDTTYTSLFTKSDKVAEWNSKAEQMELLYSYLVNKAGSANILDATTTATLWLNTTDHTLQPLVEITREHVNKEFDLSLRKSITKLNGIDYSSRLPQVDTSNLKNNSNSKTDTTAKYNHSKDILDSDTDQEIEYTLTVYNEGDLAGYAGEIKDYLPAGIEYVGLVNSSDSSRFSVNASKDSSGKTTLTITNKEKKVLQPFTGSTLDSVQFKIKCKVTATKTDKEQILTNIAEITDYRDASGNDMSSKDRDSKPANFPDSLKTNNYSGNGSDGNYVKGQEDDDDFERIKIPAKTEQPKQFDLSLRKFITKVNGTDVTPSREPKVDGTKLSNEQTTLKKSHSKTQVKVATGDTVTYTIRIYNEGQIDGTATEITDMLPDGLELIPGGNGTDQSKINQQYGWTASSDGKTIKTTYLANDTIKAYDETKSTSTTSGALNPDYRDVQIECKVIATSESNHNLRNIAAITADNGDDIDSNPDQTPSNSNYNPTNPTEGRGEEDDDDYEDLTMDSKKFDLALKKFIAAVSPDEKIDEGEYVTDTGKSDGKYTRAPKVKSITNGTVEYDEFDKTPLQVSNGDYVLYTFRIYNEGELDGYASLIRDSIPEGLEFVTTDTTYNGIWNLADDAKSITTDNLAKGKGAEEIAPTDKANLLKALQKDASGNGTVSETSPLNPDYRDVQALFRVTEPNSSTRILINQAQIADDSDENGNPIDDIDSTPDKWNEGEDDQDIEKVQLQTFDLSLRKFISKVDGVDPTTSREPQVDSTNLANGTETTATYNHSKTPLEVKKGSTVTYTIRVYNEGNKDGYASVVTDHLPAELEFIPAGTENGQSQINSQYGWTVSSDGRTVTTNYLSGDEYLLKAREDTKLYYQDLQIECKVKDTAVANKNITNIAEISEYRDENKTVVNPDRDSTSNNVTLPSDTDLPTYKDDETTKSYVPGQEDDDDFEKVYVPGDEDGEFDLSLRKFITNIAGTEETSRIPQVDTTKLADGSSTTATYTHPKDAMNVVTGDIVTYTIRVYNEGTIDGYASEIADDMPEYLTFLPENETNTTYGWKMYDKDGKETTDVANATQIKTTYLSKENEKTEGENLLKAYDKTAPVSETNPNYKDVKVAFQVNQDAPAGQVITNKAQITDDSDKDGNPVEDRDSTPNKWNEGEDDQDIENIIPSEFDLSLLKYVSQVKVTEDGKTKITETKNTGADTDIIPKVEVNRKKINSTVVKFVYTIKVTNEGSIAGYAKEVTDYVPQGLEFKAEDNPSWTAKGDGVISTRALENTLLEPGQSAPVTVVFTWINGSDNMGLKTNTAEISEDWNEKGVPDKDSTPNNQVPGEDDIDTADVLLSIKTGKVQTYFILATAVLVVLASGIVIIRKYVL